MNYEAFAHKGQTIYLVDMRKELNAHFSELTTISLEKYLIQKKKIGIIINKKGYAQGLLCQSCGYIPQCTRCSVSVTYHKQLNGDMIGLCHICKAQYPLYTNCPHCGSSRFGFFGMGTQQVAEQLESIYHTSCQIIESETANSPAKIKRFLESVKERQPGIIVGTSLLTQPLFFYSFDLLIFLNADIGLNIPDYTANERNFLFLYEAFKKHSTSHIIVQTFNPDHYSIRCACKMDLDGFYHAENPFRENNQYPPFSELCLLLYKDEIEEKLYTKVDQVYKELLYLKEKYQCNDLDIFTTPPLIYKMFGKYRYQIILKGPRVREFMDIIMIRLPLQEQGFKVNRDAESIV